MPTKPVRMVDAVTGAIIATVLFELLKRGFGIYLAFLGSYQTLYGALATLPIFLIWIYLSWVIILLGAVIAAYAPLIGKRLARWPDAPGAEFHLALVVIGQLVAARNDGRRGLEADEISEAIGIDPLQVDPVLDALAQLDWVGRLEESKGARYVLLCDPATTRAEPLFAKLLLDPAPDLEATWKRVGFDTVRLGELLRANTTGVAAG